MKVLTTSTEEQTFKFIPRDYVLSGVIHLFNKSTREEIEVDTVLEQEGSYLKATSFFSLIEGNRYSIVIKSSLDSSVIYRDTVLCTDQTEYDRYDIQKGDYVQAETSDNGYVVIKD